jgi:hypothetical protein
VQLARRLSIVGVVVAVLWFVAATMLIPTRVTLGAGSVRCGTVVAPDSGSEVGQYCGAVTAQRLREAWWTTALLAVAAAAPLAFTGSSQRSRVARSALTAVVVTVWLLGIPLMLFFITGAHSVGRT